MADTNKLNDLPQDIKDAIEKDDYRESEDEDFNPDQVVESENDSDNDEEIPSYDNIEGRGGLIKTRKQRLEEQPEDYKEAQKSSVDIDALWKEFNAPAAATTAKKSLNEESITIERTFKFAGKVTTEKKTVLKSSAEGQAYLKSQKEEKDAKLEEERKQAQAEVAEAASEASQSTEQTPSETVATPPLKKRRGPVKRKTSLLEEYEAGKAKKLNTLQKSKLDWLGFVDKEGIQDDLKRHNKNGYLDKQGFLARVEHKVDEGIKANRRTD